MVEQHKKELEKRLWSIANALRGNMSADEFRDYILGFIFYKYLSERMALYADQVLDNEGLRFAQLDENSPEGTAYLQALQTETIDQLGYFLKPVELFSELAAKGRAGGFIIDDLSTVLTHIEQSTLGTAAEDDFNGLFDDIDLTSNKLEDEEQELAFIQAFRELMRLKNVLSTFTDFNYSDLKLSEQDFEDYKSKYLDLHDKVRSASSKEKVSVLQEIDFELELIQRDEINVAYILKLLARLKETDSARDYEYQYQALMHPVVLNQHTEILRLCHNKTL